MVKWIFFDIDNTLFDTKELALRARKNAIKAMIDAGLDEDEEKVYEKLRGIVKKLGSNSDQHFNELVKSLMGWESKRVIAAGVVAYHDTKRAYLKPFPEVVPTLVELTRRGYNLGIISNGIGVKQWEKLIRMGIQHFFKVVVISGVAEVEKPFKGIFEKAISEAGCKVKDAVMIGDKEEDIVPAKMLGMKTVSMNEDVKADFNAKNFEGVLKIIDGLKK